MMERAPPLGGLGCDGGGGYYRPCRMIAAGAGCGQLDGMVGGEVIYVLLL